MPDKESVRLKWQPWEKDYGVVVQTAPLSLAVRIKRAELFSALELPYLLKRPTLPVWTYVIFDSRQRLIKCSPDIPVSKGSMAYSTQLPLGTRCGAVKLALSFVEKDGTFNRLMKKIPYEYTRESNTIKVSTENPAFVLCKKILTRSVGQ